MENDEATKWLSSDMEMDEERKAGLEINGSDWLWRWTESKARLVEKVVATKWHRLAIEMDKEK